MLDAICYDDSRAPYQLQTLKETAIEKFTPLFSAALPHLMHFRCSNADSRYLREVIKTESDWNISWNCLYLRIQDSTNLPKCKTSVSPEIYFLPRRVLLFSAVWCFITAERSFNLTLQFLLQCKWRASSDHWLYNCLRNLWKSKIFEQMSMLLLSSLDRLKNWSEPPVARMANSGPRRRQLFRTQLAMVTSKTLAGFVYDEEMLAPWTSPVTCTLG